MTRNLLLAATALVSLSALPHAATAQPVTGLYIGGAGGANFMQREVYASHSSGTYAGFETGYVGLASVGYGLGNGLRFEIEGNYRHNAFGRPSPLSLNKAGYEDKYGGMANVLFDLDIGSPYVFPYIGGGLGYSEVQQRENVFFPGFGNFPGETYRLHGTRGSFAYQAIAGLSFPIPGVVGLSLTAEYRFFSLAGNRSFPVSYSGGFGSGTYRSRTTDNYNHDLMLGVRYAFNVAPPAVAAVTDRARQVVAAAAQATTRTQVTRIEVSGNTDTTGTASYNQGLSVRRAQNVAAELVRLGVPRGAITTQGFGFSRPLVSTGPGVREPQNRRVEIVLR